MFKQFFEAEDIAEQLKSVSAEEGEQAASYFEEENYDVIGFRENGEVTGYLEKGNVADMADLKASAVPFRVSDLLTRNTELLDTLEHLGKQPHLFIINKSEVDCIITLADVQKPAVRMLFFGVVTMFENRLAELIHHTYPDDFWTDALKEHRVVKARDLYEKLRARNQETNLIACTQFADKTEILLSDAVLLEQHTGLSKTKADELFSRIRRLRDDLAHAQSLADWFENYDPVGMIRQLQEIIRRIDRTLGR
ncbi:hypothetical protein [Planomicrobium sp. YIM 101495]|uniref:hypothetical protein n=1 Tax=Planomicrobium sp. YIM 101495 TaxID=2665160 RepID=UPI0012B8E832|nr:hypothetical protein [Planomicrobium sp. YIM 101495]MTD32006.1 hypothetical protein [Planomicrobium sp. YIM 101495]